jgi:hypothetical protein
MIFPQSFSHLSQFAYNFYVLSKLCSKWHPRRWRHTCIRRAKLSMTRTHSSLGARWEKEIVEVDRHSFGTLTCVKLCISLDFYDEICFSDNKIIELKLTLFYNQIQLQTFHPSVLVTNFSSIVLFSVGDKLCIYHHWIWWQYLVT